MSGIPVPRPLGWRQNRSETESESEEEFSERHGGTKLTDNEEIGMSDGSQASSEELNGSSDIETSSSSSSSYSSSTESSNSSSRSTRKRKSKKKKSKSEKNSKKWEKPSKSEKREVKKIQSWPGGEFKGDNEKHTPRELFKLWADWSENFKNVLKLKSIKHPDNKLGLLLVYGGSMIRKVHETATLAMGRRHEKKKKDLKVFDRAWKIIDGHFRGLGSDDQERNALQRMRMKSDEKFQDWLLRLNEQLNLCNFTVERREEELRYAVMYRSIEKISEELENGSADKKSIHSLVQQAIVIDRRLSRKREEESKKATPSLESEDILAVSVSHNKRKLDENDKFIHEPSPQAWKRPKLESEMEGQRKSFGRDHAEGQPCNYCGYENHPRSVCPARGKLCNRCKYTGHFEKVCRRGRDSTTKSYQDMKQEKVNRY